MPQPGKPLGNPIAPACAEFKILNIELPQTITKTTGAFTWHTPVKRQERTAEIKATTRASVVTVQHNDKQLELLLEPPDQLGSWLSQCKELRRLVKSQIQWL